jgi:DNA-3-methyladenine glycosylase I
MHLISPPYLYIYPGQLKQKLPYRSSPVMSRANVRRHVLEKNKILKEKEKPTSTHSILSKHLKRIYPIGLQRSTSSLSLSSLSLSLSQNSLDSSATDSTIPLDQKISLALRLIAPAPERREAQLVDKNVPPERREAPADKNVQQQCQDTGTGDLIRRCNWITKNSGKFWCCNLSISKHLISDRFGL